MAEVVVAQLRMAVEPQSLNDQSIELADEEVREEKAPHVGVAAAEEGLHARVDGVAMGALQARDAFTCEQPVELPAGATIGIADQDVIELRSLPPSMAVRTASGNLVGRVVEAGRQAPQCDMGQTIRLDDLQDLPRQRSAGQDQLAAPWFADLRACDSSLHAFCFSLPG